MVEGSKDCCAMSGCNNESVVLTLYTVTNRKYYWCHDCFEGNNTFGMKKQGILDKFEIIKRFNIKPMTARESISF